MLSRNYYTDALPNVNTRGIIRPADHTREANAQEVVVPTEVILREIILRDHPSRHLRGFRVALASRKALYSPGKQPTDMHSTTRAR